MSSQASSETQLRINPFTADDVAAILRRRSWLSDSAASPELSGWLADAAALLGPQAADRMALEELLQHVFTYDARAVLAAPESLAVLTREGARDVIRELAHLVLEGPAVDSDRLKEIVIALKERLSYRSRELFQPIRLASPDGPARVTSIA